MERTHAPLLLRTGAALLALACLAVVSPGAAFAQSAGGTLLGTVQDGSGAALPGATVTATHRDTGYDRVGVSIEDGSFRLTALPAGSYDVRVELSGFAPVVVESVLLNVASQRSLEVTLQAATVEESITVVDEAPLVATEPAIGTIVSQQELENLPLNGRQFANLAALAPGTTLAYNADPTKPGQLTIALAGGIGRNVNFMVDGGDNTDDTIGGQLQNFSLESVAEFSMQTQQYKAEYGRTTGGVLSVVTKSGTNSIDGSVFGFFRDDSLNEKTETEQAAGADKPPFERQQYGFSLGGPFMPDRLHYFVTAERFDQNAPYTVATGGIFPALDGRSFPQETKDDLITAKLTADISPTQYLQVRYAYQKTETVYGAAPTVTPDGLGDLTNDFDTLLGGYNQMIGSDALNEFVVQVSEFENLILPNSNNPTIYFPSGVQSGQNINSPQSTHQEKLQIKDDFSFSTTLGGRRHDFKAGVEYIDEDTLNGFFAPGQLGQFNAIEDTANPRISDIIFFGGDFQFSTPNEQWRVYVQDDWYVNDRLTINLGVRYEYTDILELDQRSNPIWQTLSTQTTYNEFYLQDFRGDDGITDVDDDDFAPRLGFTWDVTGEAEHLLRGGWGIYYDFPYSNATVLFPSAAVQSTFGIVYLVSADPNVGFLLNPNGTPFHVGDPLPPNQIPGNIAVARAEVASPTLQTPEATQASLGWSWQVKPWLGLNVELVSIDYENLPFRFRANPRDPATGQRRFPALGNFRLWYGEGEADYDALNLSVRGRSGGKFEFQGFYTYSEAEGNILAGADEFRLTAVEHQPDLGGARDVSVNPLNPLCGRCTGPLNTDAEHRVTLSGIYRLPHGFLIGGLLRYRSALPYTSYVGSDVNNDIFNLDLGPNDPNINSQRGASLSQLDLRVAKTFALPSDLELELIGEVFNVLDDDNPVGFRGNRASAAFGQPSAFAGDPGQGEQRLAQLGLRLRF